MALPTYPFERQRFWIEAERVAPAVAAQRLDGASPLAGVALSLPSRALHHVLRVGVSDRPDLQDHGLHDIPVVAGAMLKSKT